VTAATTTATLPVVEIIGPTVQGEGPRLGRRTALIRLGGCNLTCSGCDTPYAWKQGGQSTPMTIPTIADELLDLIGGMDGYQLGTNRPFHQVVITGGEPLLHQGSDVFRELVVSLLAGGMSVEIETNGTIVPAHWFMPRLLVCEDTVGVSFVVSPKLVGGLASDNLSKRINPTALRWFTGTPGSTFKIVCRTIDDVQTVGRWADTNHIPRQKIWIMAEGASWSDHITRARCLAAAILAEGMNVSTRLHLALWPEQMRGH
jgi:7-carboxy-7-deazaguanine synthase